MILIGLSGKIGAGKTTIADMFVNRNSATRISFADGVREQTAQLCGLTPSDFSGPDKNIMTEFGYTRGQMLQRVGQEMRDIDENYWVKKFQKKLETLSGLVVVDDVRYPNELMLIKTYGECYRIYRLEETSDSRDKSHPSETSLSDSDFEHVLLNDDLESVYHQIIDLNKELKLVAEHFN